MRLEILAKRIAEKANFPGLEKALLEGRKDLLPIEPCMIWTGRKSVQGLRMRQVRDVEMRPHLTPVSTSPFPMIQYQKKVHYVQRLVYAMTGNLAEDHRLKCLCKNTLCINPHHWQSNEMVIEEPVLTEEWTLAEVEEILEIVLTEQDTVELGVGLLEGAPEDMVLETLKKMNKEHLLK